MLHKLRAAMVRPKRVCFTGIDEVEKVLSVQKTGKRRATAGKLMVAGAVEILERVERKQRVGRLKFGGNGE